jgi:hypothetical protein
MQNAWAEMTLYTKLLTSSRGNERIELSSLNKLRILLFAAAGGGERRIGLEGVGLESDCTKTLNFGMESDKGYQF